MKFRLNLKGTAMSIQKPSRRNSVVNANILEASDMVFPESSRKSEQARPTKFLPDTEYSGKDEEETEKEDKSARFSEEDEESDSCSGSDDDEEDEDVFTNANCTVVGPITVRFKFCIIE